MPPGEQNQEIQSLELKGIRLNLKCDRCGCELNSGAGRYIMTVTFMADVNAALTLEGGEGDMNTLLKEIEETPEDQLMAQVYQKRAFILCRPCKEELAANPFGKDSPPPPEPLQ